MAQAKRLIGSSYRLGCDVTMRPLYNTKLGTSYKGDSANILKETCFDGFRHKINLIFTSPPFPLKRSKAYGNLNGQDYIEWLSSFGPIFKEMLALDGSLVIELGNAWQSGSPTMSLTPIQSLIELKKKGNFHLCQEFIWNNTSRLPSPAQWVSVERIRVKDAFTRFWWLSPTPRPKADNRQVLMRARMDPLTGVRISPGLPKTTLDSQGFVELMFPNWLTKCFKWISNFLERLKPNSRVFLTNLVSRYNTTFRFLVILHSQPLAREGMLGSLL